MKDSTVLVLGAAGLLAAFLFSKNATAQDSGPQSGEQTWANQTYPSVALPTQGGSLAMPSQKAAAYNLTSTTMGTDYGNFSAAQMQSLLQGQAVNTTQGVTKIENISGSNQLVQVKTTSTTPNNISASQASAMNASLAKANAVILATGHR